MLDALLQYLNVEDLVKLAFVNMDFYVRAKSYLENPCLQVIFRINKKTSVKQFIWEDVFNTIIPYCSQIEILLDNFKYNYCKYVNQSVGHPINASWNECISDKVIVKYEKCDADYVNRIFHDIDIVQLEQSLPQRIPQIWSVQEFPPL